MSESHRQIEVSAVEFPEINEIESDRPSIVRIKKQRKNPQKQSLKKLMCITIILLGVLYTFFTFYQIKNQTKNIVSKIDKLANDLKKQKTIALKKQQQTFSPSSISSTVPNPTNPSKIQNQLFGNKIRLPSTGKLGPNGKVIQKGGIIKKSIGTVCEIEYLKKDQQGRGIQDILYSKELIQMRVQFYKRRNEIVNQKMAQFPQLALTKHNLKLSKQVLEEDRKLHEAQYERVNKIHNFDQFDSELPICVIVPGYNNNDKFRLESNLNSLFTQNYTNYFIVVLDDASTDKSNEVFTNYFNFYDINPHRYVYIKNQRRITSLENIYYTVHNICSEDSISMIVDGDDELIGKNAFKIFNTGYLRHNAGVFYSNFYFYNQDKGSISLGFTSSYTDQEKNNNRYRQIAPAKYSQLRSLRTSIFRKIEAKDLQEDNGSFYKVDADLAIFIPSMQLSCSKVFKVDGIHYLYNVNTGINDFAVNNREGARIQQRIRASRAYTCDQDFMKSINKN